MADLSLKHIYKVYPNGTKAVNDFNMQIADKEFIVFVGPSGCGKSTMLRMIAGLEEISAGELRIGGAVVNDMEPKDRDIAMVFQNYALYPHMTIYNNIAFGLEMQKVPDIKRDKKGKPVLNKHGKEIKIMRHYTKDEISKKVHEAAQILGITDYLKKKPKEMSGGQRQRVALGRAIVREPKVMLLDEPLSNLDAKLRTAMRSEIVKLHDKLQTTFIYVTHDQVEAMTMGTQIVVMKNGFIQQIDTPKNLYIYPANKFVAGFIGTPQMNFFNGTLKKDGDKVRIAFTNTTAEAVVPYETLSKVTPQYLDGEKPVCIGLRAEDISLDPEAVKNSSTVIKIKISASEELGTETLVYGDINLDYDGFEESPTRIIVKTAGFKDYKQGEVVDVALNLNAVHIFDAETEESVLPRIPEYNYLDCTVKAGALEFAGQKIALPPALSCEDGAYDLLLPSDAISFNGGIPAEVSETEDINGKILLTLSVGGKKIYAVTDDPSAQKSLKISLDLKKIILRKDGKDVITPMPLVNSINGSFAMEKAVEADENGKKKKVAKYSVVIDNEKFPAPKDVASKMFSAMSGRKVFNSTFRYEFTPYDLAVGGAGIDAKVLEVLDYGAEKFIKCLCAGNEVYVKTEGDCALSEVKLVPALERVSVVECERDIRIV